MREEPPDRPRPPNQPDYQRQQLSERVSNALDLPMAILACVWVVITAVELALAVEREEAPQLYLLDSVIWLLFLADFLLELAIAPDRPRYLRSNWLTAISVLIPAFSVFRFARAIPLIRTLSLARIGFAASRFARATATILSQNLFGYVLLLLGAITLLGAAGVYFFDRDAPGSPFTTFCYTLYWTACMVTTINAGPEPVTFEGRIVALALRVSGLAFFGYIAGALASYFVGERIGSGPDRRHKLADEVAALGAEVSSLRRQIDALRRAVAPSGRAGRSPSTDRTRRRR